MNKRKTLVVLAIVICCELMAAYGIEAAEKTATPVQVQTETKSYLKKAGKASVKKSELTAKVNVNTATAAELETLAFVGASKAAVIIAARADGMKFRSAADLLKLKGISLRIIEANKARLEYTP